MTQDLSPIDTILVVEDDELTGRFIQFILQREKYRVLGAASGGQALSLARAADPSLIVLDLMLPDLSGLQVCRGLRTWYGGPILVLSGQHEERFVIELLDSGADGYVTKPFKPGEFLARIRALLRTRSSRPASQPLLAGGDIEIDLAQRRVIVAGKSVRLTRTEFNIVAYLARNRDRALSTEEILENVWGPVHADYTQSLRVHIGHIRRKIETDPSHPRYLVTEAGGRYRFHLGESEENGESSG